MAVVLFIKKNHGCSCWWQADKKHIALKFPLTQLRFHFNTFLKMHKRFNFNTFFLNSKSPQKKEKRKKKKRIGMLDYIWLQMREEKRREEK